MLYTVSAEAAAESARLPVSQKGTASNVMRSGFKLCKMNRVCVSGVFCTWGCCIFLKLGKVVMNAGHERGNPDTSALVVNLHTLVLMSF